MKLLRFPLATALAAFFAFAGSLPVFALDSIWEGDVSSAWNTAGNWSGSNLPAASLNRRAIVGYGAGLLNSDDAPFGSPVVTANFVGGGLALGARQVNFDNLCGEELQYCDADPDPGALVGRVTMTGGTVTHRAATATNTGVDGQIRVGVEGRGYFSQSGGTITAHQITVAGEEDSSGDGRSHLRLSGTATMLLRESITASTVTGTGAAVFGRELRVTGPSVNFDANGPLNFQGSNNFTAQITSSTSHSPLKTSSNIFLDGNLFVEYSGPALAIDETWDLFDYAGGLIGNFDNEGVNRSVQITGVPALVDGETYRLRTTTGGVNGKRLQLVHQALFVLEVNRDTGEMKLTNPTGGTVEMDSYSIASAAGSLLSGYKGISGSPEADAGWEKVGLSAGLLSEIKTVGSFFPGSDVSLGTGAESGFDKFAVASTLPFGNNGEDLVFQYAVPSESGSTGDPGALVTGQVKYVGTAFDNNLVLRINPTTGAAELHNDSFISVSFDGYSILSTAAELNGAGYTGLRAGDFNWDETIHTAGSASPAAPDTLSETNLFDSITLDPDESVSIGTIASAGALSSLLAQGGLSMKFLRTNVETVLLGDYNEDGKVSAADYTVWRDHLGDTEALPNDDTEGVGTDDYDRWIANFGLTGGGLTDELTFRVGSVRFDLGAGSGSGSSASAVAVPEPNSALLMLMGFGAVVLFGRGRSNRAHRQSGQEEFVRGTWRQLGVRNMSRQFGFGFGLLALVGLGVVLANSSPALAVTQGITMSNIDFELPGPVGTKTIAFDEGGVSIPNIIPGWTFPGPGVETFGHPDQMGDSGVEGGGNPGNEMILSTHDGIAYQVSSVVVQAIPSTQQYVFSFDYHSIFTVPFDSELDTEPALNVRFTYGASRLTWYEEELLLDPEVEAPEGGFFNYQLVIPHNSSLLQAPYLGQVIGIEFDVTSAENDANIDKQWIGVDNLIMQIRGVLPGDLNGDGVVNTADYAIIRDNLETSQAYSAAGEMNGDYVVDLDDFRAFKTLYAAQGAGSSAGVSSSTGGSLAVPEPSTLILALIVAAVFGGSFARRKSNMLQRIVVLAVVAAGAGLVTASSASADLLYYDPFLLIDSAQGSNPETVEPGVGEYATHPPSFIAGQNPTTTFGSDPTFFSGAWVTPAPAEGNGIVRTTGLSYIGAPALGGSYTTATTDLFNESNNGRSGRYLTTEWDETTDATYFLSFMANFGTTAGGDGGMGYRSIEFWPAGSSVGIDDGRMDIGYNQYFSSLGSPQQNPATARIQWVVPGTGGGTTILPDSPLSYNDDGITHLIVLKFDLSPDDLSDTISLYLDPTSLEEPEVPSATFSGVNYTMTAMGAMSRFGGGFNLDGTTNGSFDELRIGELFSDVMPELPYPGDTDGDGDADLDDLALIKANWGMSVTGGPADGDVAGPLGRQGSDNFVGLADFRVWKDWRNCPAETCDDGFGAGAGTGVSAQAPGVPEPASMILALVAALALAKFARPRR